MIWIYLVLIVVVIAFGLGVVVWNRRRSGPGSVGGATVTPPAVERPPEGRGAPTAVLERAPPAAPPVEVVEPATLRGRMSRARAALAGVFTTVLGRSGITDETWVELEEALLRADLGVHVTTELLDGLRAKVKAKEIDGSRRADRRAPRRDAVSPHRRRSGAALRRRRGAERVAVRRRQRRRQDDVDRQGRQPAGGGRPIGAAGRGRHVPRRRRRAARHVGVTGRRRAGAGERGRRSERRGVRRRRAGRVAPRRSGARRHRRAPAHQDEPDGGAAQGAPGRREGRRHGDRGAAGDRRHHRPERPRPRRGSSARRRSSPGWC